MRMPGRLKQQTATLGEVFRLSGSNSEAVSLFQDESIMASVKIAFARFVRAVLWIHRFNGSADYRQRRYARGRLRTFKLPLKLQCFC